MATLKEKIVVILKQNPKGIKAREIAIKIGVSRTEINSYLYSHKSEYSIDDNYLWTIKVTEPKTKNATVKIKDEWHDTSNVRAINEELKRQRLERKRIAEEIAQKVVANLRVGEDVIAIIEPESEEINEPKVDIIVPKRIVQKDKEQIYDGSFVRECRTCGKNFKLSQSEIEFYQNKGLCLPTHCRECLDSGIAGIEYIRETYGVRSYSNFGHIPRKFGGPKN